MTSIMNIFKLKGTAFLLVLLACSGIDAQIAYGDNPEAGHYVLAGDARIYYEVYGSGEPIVLLHGGLMGAISEMTGFIESLKPDYQVIAMATRGHGKSEIGSAPITYELKANDVMAVVNAVTTDSVILLGFSDGAYSGYKVASMYPNRIKKLIAIGAGEQIPGLRKVVPLSGETVDLESEFWQQRLALMPEPERIEEFWLEMADFYNTMTASKELFATIQCPVLVMSGELDRNAPLETVINAYHMIPNSHLSIIPNTGHVVFMQNFDAVWASVVPFLSKGPMQHDSDLAAVEMVLENYKTSIIRADTTLAATFWLTTPEASFIHPRGYEKGWEGIKSGIYEMFGSRFTFRDLKSFDESIQLFGDMAVVEFYWVFDAVYSGENPTPVQTRGRETQVMKKFGDSWKIVHVHYSGMPATGEREGF